MLIKKINFSFKLNKNSGYSGYSGYTLEPRGLQRNHFKKQSGYSGYTLSMVGI